jgi:hypothetical protein
MICQTRFHCWRNSQSFVNSAEVVVHEMQGHGMTVILDLFGKAVCEPRETAHAHTHREFLTFYKAGRDVVRVRRSRDCSSAASNASSGAVTALIQAGRHSVNFYQHRIVNFGTKRIFHGIHVNPVTVCGELETVLSFSQWRLWIRLLPERLSLECVWTV